MGKKDKSHKGKATAQSEWSEWSQWSDWIWDNNSGTYYSELYGQNGEVLDYVSSSNPDREDPRSAETGGMTALTQQLEGTTLAGNLQDYGDPDVEYGLHGVQDYNQHTGSDTQSYEATPGNTSLPLQPDGTYREVYEDGRYPVGQNAAADYQPLSAIHEAGFSPSDYKSYSQTQEENPTAHYNTTGHGQTLSKDRRESTQQYKGTVDEGFVLHHSKDFVEGSIVKCWAPMARGQNMNRTSKGQSTLGPRKNVDFSQMTFEGFRRFIIIENWDGHSIGIPISSYGARGCSKTGVHEQNHGIIHDSRTTARLAPGEPPLGFYPVRAEMFENTETLTKTSRVDFTKRYTIEHNTFVYFLGEVHPDDLDYVLDVAENNPNTTKDRKRSHAKDKSGHSKDKHSHSKDKSSHSKDKSGHGKGGGSSGSRRPK